jgi:hypothetical protein
MFTHAAVLSIPAEFSPAVQIVPEVHASQPVRRPLAPLSEPRMPRLLLVLMLATAVLLTGRIARAQEEFPLDHVPRIVEAEGKIHCPKVELVTYRGDVLRYKTPVRVYSGFRERLRLFEEVTRDVAIEVYGRAPSHIRHLGTLNCRRIRTWPRYLSEHGLGNAIDVAGFDFPPLPRKLAKSSPLLPPLKRAFTVKLDPDWEATTGAQAVHAHFLRLLAERLVARQDIFRVLLGPAYPGHKNHFHFDCAPWRIVEVFARREP